VNVVAPGCTDWSEASFWDRLRWWWWQFLGADRFRVYYPDGGHYSRRMPHHEAAALAEVFGGVMVMLNEQGEDVVNR
jgi:hypothetical protein